MQLTPLQQPWDGKISNSMDDQEVPRELVLKIKEDFQANGGNKAALEEQYSADVVHRVLGVVKNSNLVTKKNKLDYRKPQDGDDVTVKGDEDTNKDVSITKTFDRFRKRSA